MEFFNSAIEVLKVLVMALGAGLAVWGVVNLLEGYGSDNPAANAHVHKVTHKNLIDNRLLFRNLDDEIYCTISTNIFQNH